jgi:hypothetical protein
LEFYRSFAADDYGVNENDYNILKEYNQKARQVVGEIEIP